MATTLSRTDLGPMSLAAPTGPVRHVRATYGHLWQWTGDGADLFSLSVAVRLTRVGTPAGVHDHLHHELELMRVEPPGPSPDDSPGTRPSGAAVATQVDLWIDGATSAEAAETTGEVRGHLVRQRVVVCTDGELMHVVRVLVPDTPAGDDVLAQVTSSLQVRPWEMPA